MHSFNTDVDVMFEAGREKESVGINKISSDFRNTSWHTVRSRCGQICQLPVCLMDEMSILCLNESLCFINRIRPRRISEL